VRDTANPIFHAIKKQDGYIYVISFEYERKQHYFIFNLQFSRQ